MTKTPLSFEARQRIFWIVTVVVIVLAVSVFFSTLIGLTAFLTILGFIAAFTVALVGIAWSGMTFRYWSVYGVWDWKTCWTGRESKRAARGDFKDGAFHWN